jgi:CrcB protein
MEPMTIVVVMIAGGLGSGARYAIGLWALNRMGAQFPFGTLIVNLAGCFALGAVAQWAASGSWPPETRAAIGAGFLGGFTTYSSFNQETIALFTSGAAGAAAVNVAVTLAGGLAAGGLGAAAARLFQS